MIIPKQPKIKSRNLADYSYEELLWLGSNKCKHGHKFISHLNCWLDCGEVKKERIGFLDIETSNLVAAFGVVICWCIKDKDSDYIYEDYLEKKDIYSDDEDKRIIETCIDSMKQFDRIVGHYSCLTPSHTILMNNMEYKKLGNVKVGDKIITFQEKAKTGGSFRRKFIESKITFKQIIERPCLEISLSDGTTITCSKEHPFLVPTKHNGANWNWKFAEHLKKGDVLTRIIPEWSENNTYNYGYLSAAFDGEEWTNLQQGLSMGFAQKNNVMYEAVIKLLNEKNISYNIRKSSKLNRIKINGIANCFNLLGILKPKRLLNNFYKRLENKNLCLGVKNDNKRTTIISIKDIGLQKVVGISTDSGTYISNGFPSHNSRFDIPFLRTRALMHDGKNALGFPKQGELIHTDTWLMARSKFKFHSNRQNIIAETLFNETIKTRIDHRAWRQALQGNTKAILESLDHCEKDVLELERNFLTMLPFCKLTRTSI